LQEQQLPLHVDACMPPCLQLIAFAKALTATVAQITTPTGEPVSMRVGCHTGSVMSGVVGTRMPTFCERPAAQLLSRSEAAASQPAPLLLCPCRCIWGAWHASLLFAPSMDAVAWQASHSTEGCSCTPACLPCAGCHQHRITHGGGHLQLHWQPGCCTWLVRTLPCPPTCPDQAAAVAAHALLLQSTGRPGIIHVSRAMRDLTPEEPWVATAGVEAKGACAA
jgi:hypothetical protein